MSSEKLKDLEKQLKAAQKEAEKELAKQLKAAKKEEIKNDNDYSKYIELKDNYEKIWFKLINPTCFVREKEDGELIFKSHKDMECDFEHIHTEIKEEGKIKEKDFFSLWRKDKNIRVYDNIVFKPTPLIKSKDEYNSFKGFPKHEGKLINIQDFHDYISVLCNGDKKSIDYMNAYLADIIQNPGLQNRSHGRCIILKGDQGCGKSTLEKIMNGLIGSNYVNSTADINSVIKNKDNRFADGAVNKLLVVLEEVNSEEGHCKADLLKDIITSEYIQRELKGINGIMKYKNYSRFIVPTNHKRAIKIESSDRRYIIFVCSNKYLGDWKHWNSFYERIKNKDWLYSVYNFLSTLDIKNFNFADRPITEAYERDKSHSIPYPIRFIHYLITYQEKAERRYSIDELFDLLDAFLKSNKFKFDMNKPSFKNELDELALSNDKVGIYKKKNGTMKYYFVESEFKEYCDKKKYSLFNDKETEGATDEIIIEI